MQLCQMGPKQFRVITNLRHRPDRRARRFDRVALFDGDGGRNSFDAIDLRFVHAVEKLPRIRRKSFDVTSLAFRKKCVKGERTFSRAAESGDDDQFSERQIEVEIFQVVVPHTAKANKFWRGLFQHGGGS